MAPVAWEGARVACPKHMAHGPCAGVADDGACEVPGFGVCPYPAAWPFPAGVGRVVAPVLARPFVLTDLPAAPLDSASLREAARALSGAADAVLLGDHGAERVQFPPSYRARLLADAGISAWPGLNCRDRNRVALEGELAACADAGAAGVHCVTGDHPALGHRPDAMAVFDLDSTGLAALARAAGLLVSVAHAPTVPPVALRVPRVLNKGADVIIIDHCGGPDAVHRAAGALRDAGFGGSVLACVPVPPVVTVEAAVGFARAVLEHPGVDGVNLSGGRGGAGAARDLAVIGRELRP